MSHVIDWIFDHRWAITDNALRNILAIASHESTLQKVIETVGHEPIEALAAKDGQPLQGARRAEVQNGIAVININGPIIPRANLFSAISGATSIQMLAKDFTTALQDEDAYAIALNIDSPGGEITMVSEFANMIYSARDKKPVIAYINGIGASAAYWLASAASKVYISDTGLAGSIGVVLAYQDSREKDKKAGVETVELVSSRAPNKRPDPKTDQGRSQIQAELDALEDVFISAVAKYRGVDIDHVIANYGQGGIFVGQQAVTAGLVDSVSNFEQVLQTIRDNHEQSNKNSFPLYAAGGSSMNVEKLKTEHKDLYDAVHALGHEAGKAEGLKAGIEQGAEKERNRIKSVASITAPGADAIVKEQMFNPEATKESVAVLILDKQAAMAASAASGVSKDAIALATGLQKINSTPIGGNGSAADAGEQAQNDQIIKAAADKVNSARR